MADQADPSLPTSPLPFVISILPVLLSPSFVHLPAPYLSTPVHLRHQFLRPSSDAPEYLQATNDTIVQTAVEARRERLISARWGIEEYTQQDDMRVEWNAELKDDEGIRARIRIGGSHEQDQLALVVVWEEVRQDAGTNGQENDAEDVEEAGWRYYDLQLPDIAGKGEKWYNSYEEAVTAVSNKNRKISGKTKKVKKAKSSKKKGRTLLADDETGLQGEEGGEQDPDDYWAGCTSSEASSSSGAESLEEDAEDVARQDNDYWASYGENAKNGSIGEEEDASSTMAEQSKDKAEPRNSVAEQPKSAVSHLGYVHPGFTAQKRNVSFLQEPGSSTRAVTPEVDEMPSQMPAEVAKPSTSSLLGQSLQQNANHVSPTAPAIYPTSAFTQEKRNISFMNEHSGFGTSYNDDYDFDNDGDTNGAGYNYRGFYDYPNVSYPASSAPLSPRPTNARVAAVQHQTNGIASLSSSPTKAVMSSVSSRLQAGHYRDEAVRNAMRGIWDLYRASAASNGAKLKDSRIEQYEFMELVRSVVEAEDMDE